MKQLQILGTIAASLMAVSANAITIGTTDTFEDGTEMGWSGGNFPVNVSGGQASSKALEFASGGGKLAAYNTDTRWTGDYIAAGVFGIKGYFQNRSTVPMEIRLVMFNGRFERWTSSGPLEMGVSNAWIEHTFEIAESQLTRVAGSAGYAASLANIDRVMFRHDPGSPDSGGTPVDGALRIDNIEAIGAPGPTISGDITLLDTAGSGGTEDLTWTLTQGSNVYTGTLTVDDVAISMYSINIPPMAPNGAYSLKIKGGTFLSDTNSVLLTGSSVTSDLALMNGDIDQDAEVGPGDFEAVVAQFGGAGTADCDNDSEVGPSDFEIVVANFGLGDE
jgi:hypothetical protein